jgi:hypothetical protein
VSKAPSTLADLITQQAARRAAVTAKPVTSPLKVKVQIKNFLQQQTR